MRRSPLLVLALAVALTTACGSSSGGSTSTVAGGGSTSDGAAAAQTTVCQARDDIQSKIDDLASMDPQTATIAGITADITAIRDDLQQVKSAIPNLAADRKQPVQDAATKLQEDVGNAASDLLAGGSAADAKQQIVTGAQALRTAFDESLSRVEC